MMTKHPFFVSAALALLACVAPPQSAEQDAKQAPEQLEQAPSEEATLPREPDYARFGMPDVEKPWSDSDYSAAREAITAIAKEDFKLLPRNPSTTFMQLANIERLRELAGGISAEQLARLSLSLGAIHMVYGDQIRRDPEFEREHLILTAALLAVTSKLPATTVRDEAEAIALRSEPGRLKGLLRFRHGVYELVAGMLAARSPKSVVPLRFACEQLARVIDDAAPLLLEEERASLRERVAACEGARLEAIEMLQRALASEAPTAPLVTALLTEHREFAGTQ
jgi:hypothetical protein